ncbi:MAG: WecB/TagA/CpsF family glycosyltransferase [Candidatus Kerfeldbacteria bacterium]|nr:WecB/TagA/CpsF family glycosyltransferase [Candidatus Kerfeldbacteria bacterium]
MNILGVKIDNIPFTEAIKKAKHFLSSSVPHFIITPNPEILLYAAKSEEYRRVLNSSHLALPDGFGLRLVSGIKHTVTGVSFAEALLKMADEKQLRVYCLVRADGRSSLDQIVRAVQQRAPCAVVQGIAVHKSDWRNSTVVEQMNTFAPHIIFVGFGFPEQEYWLAEHLKDIPSVRIGVGIGGAFDFWTGVAQRAPHWVQRVRFEWLWRLVHEPRRITRIFRALILFPCTVIMKKFIHLFSVFFL